MEIKIKKKLWLQSVLSFFVAATFIFVGIGSIGEVHNYLFEGIPEDDIEKLPTGEFQHTHHASLEEKVVKTGNRDENGKWHGQITIVRTNNELGTSKTEEVDMVHGKKHGKSTVTLLDWRGNTVYHYCYNMDNRVECEKAAYLISENSMAYDIFSYRFPWYLHTLNNFGFENDFINAYTDTLEMILDQYEFEANEFNDFYEDAMDALDGTIYDSIIDVNSNLTIYRALEELRNAEFRLAVIDGFQMDEFDTYNSVQSDYRNYLYALNDSGITNADFEIFCHVFDSLMMSYGTLDIKDPFFIDSMDIRIFRALDFISSKESQTSIVQLSLKSSLILNKYKRLRKLSNIVSPLLKQFFLDSSPFDVSQVVLLSMYSYYLEAEFIRNALLEAWMIKKEIVRLPVVTTELTDDFSESSVSILGTVIDNGGAEITDRGIVWESFYNPTLEDFGRHIGEGSGEFEAMLDRPNPGFIRYARAFATNSAGTAYGNCIEFTASATTGINSNELGSGFKIYPNPASDFVTVKFPDMPGNLVFTIIDINGRVVYNKQMQSGLNSVELYLSRFENGIYNCLLTNGEESVTRKLLIVN